MAGGEARHDFVSSQDSEEKLKVGHLLPFSVALP